MHIATIYSMYTFKILVCSHRSYNSAINDLLCLKTISRSSAFLKVSQPMTSINYINVIQKLYVHFSKSLFEFFWFMLHIVWMINLREMVSYKNGVHNNMHMPVPWLLTKKLFHRCKSICYNFCYTVCWHSWIKMIKISKGLLFSC